MANERLMQVPPLDLATALDEALHPRPLAPGFAVRQAEVAQPVHLPPWFIDRCRHAYLSVPAEPDSSARLIGVTSAYYGEGKTSIAIGMATALAADTQMPTVLLECDLERPSFSRFFNFEPRPGLGDWLDGMRPLRILRAAPFANEFVIPAGNPPADPARLFYQLRESRLIDELRPRFPNIIVDLPPVLNIAYSSLALNLADRIVMVARYGVTPIDDIEKVVFLLGRERLSGIVLNGTEYKTPSWLRRVL